MFIGQACTVHAYISKFIYRKIYFFFFHSFQSFLQGVMQIKLTLTSKQKYLKFSQQPVQRKQKLLLCNSFSIVLFLLLIQQWALHCSAGVQLFQRYTRPFSSGSNTHFQADRITSALHQEIEENKVKASFDSKLKISGFQCRKQINLYSGQLLSSLSELNEGSGS